MRRRETMAAACCWLLLAAAAWGGPKAAVPLKVEGDTVVIVKSLPCTVTAAPGADFYLWNVPDTVKAESADNVLTITAAPAKGSFKVSVVSVTIDIKLDDKGKVQKTVVKDRGEVEVNVGDVPAPPGPTPGPEPVPPPDDALTKSLRAAYAADTGEKKAEHVAKLAALYRQAANLDLRETKTAGDLYAVLIKASRALLPADVLMNTRKAVAAELKEVLPAETAAELTQDHRANAKSLFVRLSKSLDALAATGVKR